MQFATGACPRCGHRPEQAGVTAANGSPPHGLPASPARPPVPPEGAPGDGTAPHSGKLTPELLEWARKQFSEEEILAGLREIQQTGGLELRDFIQELEQEAARRE
jgi:hypothetical protein